MKFNSKKNKITKMSLEKIQSIIDENKESLSDSSYLELCNLTKDLFIENKNRTKKIIEFNEHYNSLEKFYEEKENILKKEYDTEIKDTIYDYGRKIFNLKEGKHFLDTEIADLKEQLSDIKEERLNYMTQYLKKLNKESPIKRIVRRFIPAS